jgi:hypothetical protein
VRAGRQLTTDCSHAPPNAKSKPMQAPCEPTTRISYGFLGRRRWLGNHRASRADPTSIRQRARTVQPELGEPRRRHLGQRKSYSTGCHRQRLVKRADNSASAGVCMRVYACVGVPLALTGLTGLTGPTSRPLGNCQKAGQAWYGHTLCDQQPVRRTRNTNLILPPTKPILGLPGSASGSNEGVPTNYCQYACRLKKFPDRSLTHK